MPSTRQLKSRIRSVRSTRQITRAMQLVAASKLRRAQDSATATAAYSDAARELLTHLSGISDTATNPLYQARPLQHRLVIAITSDKGLAGAYNSNVLRALGDMLIADRDQGVTTSVITVGKKAAHFVSRLNGVTSLGSYENFSESPSGADIRPIITTAVTAFSNATVDAVDVIYTKFVSSLRQEAMTFRLLPAGYQEVQTVDSSITQAEFEPSAEEVLAQATLRLIEAQLFQALLDSIASEQSMRMLAMKNATDNAGDIIDDLTLLMNKVRQGAITQELAEISGGAEAIK